ncbi:MAG: hypothetical protein S4CHLAM102_02770 [Chlamydiia bacterium]|nr:hypothetical protein [Chlamydiia bacterium]
MRRVTLLGMLIGLTASCFANDSYTQKTKAFDNKDSQHHQQMDEGCEPIFPTCDGVVFELFGQALFLQPNGSSIYYAAEAIPLDPNISIPAVSPNWNIYEIKPDYAVGFNVGMALLFTPLNTRLQANWERLYSRDSANHNVPLTSDMIGPLFDIGPNSAAYTSGKGHVKFDFDSADLIFAQQFCVFKRLYPSVYAGGAFARIKQSLTSTYFNSDQTRKRKVKNYSTFIGGGPKFGATFDYRMFGDIFFTGLSSAALIIGESKNGTTYKSWAPFLVNQGIPQPNTQKTKVPNRTQLIPGFEERLGFSYVGVFDCWKLKIGLGYQAEVYIDAVQSIDMTAPQVIPTLAPGASAESGVFAVGFERTLSNFILQGPYLSIDCDF